MTRLSTGKSWLWMGLALLLPFTNACTRGYYRRQADVDAARLTVEKINHPHWDIPRQTIAIDPRSRMFDPFSPDCEPMPPDDPYSHQLMHYVDGKKGWRKWHQFGDTSTVENPGWLDYLPLDENGVLLLDSERAYQLALLHSRDYQEQFETLYLSALDVSAERFRFDTQFFGGYSAQYTTTGRNRTPRSQLTTGFTTRETGRFGLPTGVTAPSDADVLIRRAFATGGELAVGIANSLTWDLAGPNNYSSLTILDFSFVQPLLRLAGRERVLEQLTLSERQLLANVRQMERYRQAFFVEMYTGRDAGNGATRRGGLFGGAGLEGFTGVGGGGFGRVGGANTGGGNTQLTAPQAGGFLGLLQQQQNVRIQAANVAGLRTSLAQLREALRENLTKIPDDPETSVRDRLQVAQARQAMLNSETRLLSAQASYQQSLDTYKIRMGLPPSLCVSLNDPMLDRFNLIDPEIVPVQNEITRLRDEVGVINAQLLAQVRTVDMNAQRINTLAWSNEVAAWLEQLRQRVRRIRELRAQLANPQYLRARADLEVLVQSLSARRQELDRLRRKYFEIRDNWDEYGGLDPCQVKLDADIDPSVFDTQRLDSVPATLDKDLKALVSELQEQSLPLENAAALLDDLLGREIKPQPAELYRELEATVIFGIPSLLTELAIDALDFSLIQARARVDAVQLTPVDMNWDFAVEIARRYRHDWMNARASLVDTYRLIFFNADALQSTLDVTFAGDLRNVSDNPLDLGTRAGRLRVGLEFDGPWTRLRERNTYRQALIEYQEARRNFYAFEDAIAASLRDTIRTIDLNQLNFEERRIAVLSAIEQVVLNDEIQRFREERGLATGTTAARDAVSALSDLQEAQNLFLGIWVNYEALRVILDLDLGTMQLDGDGNWIDPGPMGPSYGLHLPEWDAEGPAMLFPLVTEPQGVETVPPGAGQPLLEPAAGSPGGVAPGESAPVPAVPTGVAPPPVVWSQSDLVPASFLESMRSDVPRRLPILSEELRVGRPLRADRIPESWSPPSGASAR